MSMEYFLPIAEVYVNLPLIFILSLVVGVLSGLFGVGGGFLMTPFLIFLGIPPAYAVPNEASNILGTSVSGSTTFSEMLSKASMYQASLFALNLILIISSVVMIFSGYTLITTYHFDKIYYPKSKLEDLWPFNALYICIIGEHII